MRAHHLGRAVAEVPKSYNFHVITFVTAIPPKRAGPLMVLLPDASMKAYGRR